MKTIFLIALLFCSTLLWAGDVSIGISPGSITLDNVLKGGYAEGAFSVGGGSDGSETMLVTLGVSGPIKDWVSFEQQQITVETGTMKQVKFTVRPPNTTANGVYDGTIIATAVPSAEGLSGTDSELSVVSSVSLALSVGVTGEQTLDLVVDDAAVGDIEEGQPLQAVVTARNPGNVNVAPSVKLEVLQDSTLLMSERKTSTVEILPTTTKSFSTTFSTMELVPGDYNATVSVFLSADDNTPISQTTVPFKVFPAGTLGLSGAFESLAASGGYVNEQVRVQGAFRNTGNGGVVAQLKGDVERGGAFVSAVESDEVYVPAGSTVTLVAYYTPTEKGSYSMSAYVKYSKLQTETKDTTFNVAERPTSVQAPSETTTEQGTAASAPNYAIFGVVVVLVVALAILWKYYFSGESKPKRKR